MANQFVWYELVTSDIDAALAFYGNVLGWRSQDFRGTPERYAVISAGDKGVGGVMALPAGMSQPFWLGYIGVPDIDAAVARFTGAGGTLQRGPFEIPEVGRIALVSDPQGAGLALFQDRSDRKSEAFDQQRPGHGNWHELAVADPGAAFDFYAGQFGWTKGDAIPMGEAGVYQLFKSGDGAIGGMVKACDQRSPGWLYYFGVESIRGAISSIEQAGGAVLHGPQEVPGGALILHAKDPQGAVFALVGSA